MSNGISAMAREYLELWVAYEATCVQEDLETEFRLGTKAAAETRKQGDRMHHLEREVCKAVANTPVELRAKAAVVLVHEINRSDDIDLVASITCDLLGVRSVADLGDDVSAVAMEILRRGLV
ncbi:hypothetical protein E2C06_30615 [Dankookia rubra]|uniref:Uncharacterized protein n=1 Tax=Dankookia rubra TaxID=1442381 RepID=A0A4R5Q894_9PROT|nr:hypothetical protein [Dankookia rubra]TDH58823.1 hypothetical protein E2C06_30615 [Dankookia rubra]